MTEKKAKEFEAGDILWYLEHPDELQKFLDGVIDDELTKGRIRSIYVRVKYGQASVKEIAEYYDLPEKLVRNIADGITFRGITMGTDDYASDKNQGSRKNIRRYSS